MENKDPEHLAGLPVCSWSRAWVSHNHVRILPCWSLTVTGNPRHTSLSPHFFPYKSSYPLSHRLQWYPGDKSSPQVLGQTMETALWFCLQKSPLPSAVQSLHCLSSWRYRGGLELGLENESPFHSLFQNGLNSVISPYPLTGMGNAEQWAITSFSRFWCAISLLFNWDNNREVCLREV